jgi:hypothetical protein
MTQDPQLARHGLFDARVPRYTSYPTAPHFGTGVGPTEFLTFGIENRAVPYLLIDFKNLFGTSEKLDIGNAAF